MIRFVDDHRDVYGVESICAVLPIAPSTYYLQKAREADPTQRSARSQQDDQWRDDASNPVGRQVQSPLEPKLWWYAMRSVNPGVGASRPFRRSHRAWNR